jgi:hypothetical protein
MAKKREEKVEKSKKFVEYKKSTPLQMSLFDLLNDEKDFSHTIELYDFMPKYFWGKPERVDGVYLPRLEREFECRSKKYTLTLYPASIEDSNGNEKYHYPAKREEIVEDALRKIMAEGHGMFLDGQAGLSFSLYEVQKELKENGHSYSTNQIKDAIEILAKTNIELKSFDGELEFIFHPIEAVGFTGEDEEIQTFVKFSPLVTRSIKEKSFRLFNYKKVMSYDTVIARQLHKRMAHHFTQAGLTENYTIMLTTIIRDFGLTRRKQLKDNLRELEIAIEELKKSNVIINFTLDKVVEKSPRLKLIDVKLTIQPHFEFISEIKHANTRRKLELIENKTSKPNV